MVTMEAAQPVGDAPAEEPELTCIPDARGDLVVAVDAETMGRGSDELGKLLMKSFLFAVGQLPRLPKTMLFYNGGAKLTVEGSASLEDLKGLEAQGVEILTCGTCLNFLWPGGQAGGGRRHQHVTPSWRRWRMPGRSSSHDLPGQCRHHPAKASGRGGGRSSPPWRSTATAAGAPIRRRWPPPGAVYGVRRQIAELFRCPRPDHVAFTPNSTMALNIAVSGLLGPVGPRDLHGPGAQLRPAPPVPPAGAGGRGGLPPRRPAGKDRLWRSRAAAAAGYKGPWCVPTAPTSPEIWWTSAGVGDFCQKHGLLSHPGRLPDRRRLSHRYGADAHRRGVLHRPQEPDGSPGHRGAFASGRGWRSAPSPWGAPACRATPRPSPPSTPPGWRRGPSTATVWRDWGPLWSIWELSAGRGSAPTRPLWPGNSMKQLKTFPM